MQTVHFSDESNFVLNGSDGKTYVREKVGKELSPQCPKASVKFGEGISWIESYGDVNSSANSMGVTENYSFCYLKFFEKI